MVFEQSFEEWIEIWFKKQSDGRCKQNAEYLDKPMLQSLTPSDSYKKFYMVWWTYGEEHGEGWDLRGRRMPDHEGPHVLVWGI